MLFPVPGSLFPVASTTEAAVSSHDVSMAKTRMGTSVGSDSPPDNPRPLTRRGRCRTLVVRTAAWPARSDQTIADDRSFHQPKARTMPGDVIHRRPDPAAKWADPQPKPPGYVAPEPTPLDRLIAGLASPKDVAAEIVQEAYGPLKQFCALPAGFTDRVLAYERRGVHSLTAEQIDELNEKPPATIVDPHPPQIETIELLRLYLDGHQSVCRNGDPFQPLFGVNLVGPPGCGKTHILSAFARSMRAFLEKKLDLYRVRVAEFVRREYGHYRLEEERHRKALAGIHGDGEQRPTIWVIEDALGDVATPKTTAGVGDDPVTGEKRPSLMELAAKMPEGIVERKAPETVFLEKLTLFRQALSRLQYQPTDFLYLDFDSLWELCRGDSGARDAALAAITSAKVVFLDDVHPKGDPERVQIVLHVIEGRYAAGRMGTFITTNLTTEELAGRDAQIASRLQSRCSEMFYEVNFEGCIDWRSTVKRRRIELARALLRSAVPGLHDTPRDSPPTAPSSIG